MRILWLWLRVRPLYALAVASGLVMMLVGSAPAVLSVPLRDASVGVPGMAVGLVAVFIPASAWSPLDVVERSAARSPLRGRAEVAWALSTASLATAAGVMAVAPGVSCAALLRNASVCAALGLASTTLAPASVAWTPVAVLLGATFVFGPGETGLPARWAILLHPAGALDVLVSAGVLALAIAFYIGRGAKAPT